MNPPIYMKLSKLIQFIWKEHRFAMSISLITMSIMLTEPSSSTWLRYQSIEVSNGQWWRIFTANFCHSNWNHWLLNITGLWLMDVFYQPVLAPKQRAGLLMFCMTLNVLFLHLFLNLKWYVGLSGALHGYLIGGALLSWNSAKKLNLVILLVVTGKLFVESHWQINSMTEKYIGANVVEQAHSFGGLSAVIYFFGFWSLNRIKTASKSQR